MQVSSRPVGQAGGRGGREGERDTAPAPCALCLELLAELKGNVRDSDLHVHTSLVGNLSECGF